MQLSRCPESNLQQNRFAGAQRTGSARAPALRIPQLATPKVQAVCIARLNAGPLYFPGK